MQISTIDDVRQFFHTVVYDYSLEEFHPDDDFSNYINPKTKEPLFTAQEATLFNQLLQESFSVCENADVDIYDLGWEVIEQWMLK